MSDFIRPTASSINDDQVDLLFEGLEEVLAAHYPHKEGDWCTECRQATPCRTVRMVQATFIKIEAVTGEHDQAEETDRVAREGCLQYLREARPRPAGPGRGVGERVTDEEFDRLSLEEQDLYLKGVQDGIKDAERATPPLLRRFFWWDLETIAEDARRKLFSKGGDEYCNDTIGIRLKGGVLFIRRNRKVRLEHHPDCPKCKEESA